MQLKDMTFVGISNDPNSGYTLKKVSDKDKEFTWPSGNFYMIYPVQKQSLVCFGDNSQNRLGNNSAGYKNPVIQEPDQKDGKDVEFNPHHVYGVANYTAVID
jgi:hypothetical protein